jgi:hypothetical protein
MEISLGDLVEDIQGTSAAPCVCSRAEIRESLVEAEDED